MELSKYFLGKLISQPYFSHFIGGHKFCNSNRDYIATEPALPPATRTRHRNASRTQKPLPYYNTVSQYRFDQSQTFAVESSSTKTKTFKQVYDNGSSIFIFPNAFEHILKFAISKIHQHFIN